jgi:hypothetical protein
MQTLVHQVLLVAPGIQDHLWLLAAARKEAAGKEEGRDGAAGLPVLPTGAAQPLFDAAHLLHIPLRLLTPALPAAAVAAPLVFLVLLVLLVLLAALAGGVLLGRAAAALRGAAAITVLAAA